MMINVVVVVMWYGPVGVEIDGLPFVLTHTHI